jgi:DNA polymerase-1
MKKIYLVDGMSLVFRAYHAMSRSGLKSPGGEPTAAVFGFVNILTSLLEKEKPENIAVVFDMQAPTFRHERYELYKAHRDAFPEDLVPQLIKIKEFLDYISVPRIELSGYEADDVIGTLACRAAEEKMEVICLTSDKDFYQLVNNYVKLYKPSKNSNEDFEIVDINGVKEKFGVAPAQVIDVLALTGDASDNVPGVKGIGDKTAIPLIQKYGSVENLYEHLDEIDKATVRTKLEKDKDLAFLSKELVTIMCEAPVNINLDYCVRKEPKFKDLDKFFGELGFVQIRKKWRDKAAEMLPEESTPEFPPPEQEIIQSAESKILDESEIS